MKGSLQAGEVGIRRKWTSGKCWLWKEVCKSNGSHPPLVQASLEQALLFYKHSSDGCGVRPSLSTVSCEAEQKDKNSCHSATVAVLPAGEQTACPSKLNSRENSSVNERGHHDVEEESWCSSSAISCLSVLTNLTLHTYIQAMMLITRAVLGAFPIKTPERAMRVSARDRGKPSLKHRGYECQLWD